MVNQLPHGGRGPEKKIGALPKAVQSGAAEIVETVKHGQSETSDQVKKLEVERIKLRLENLKDRLEEVRQLAISEGCPDPKAKKTA